MTTTWILWGLAIVGACHVVASVGPHFWTRRDSGGDRSKGLVIFAESIRWLDVRWGMRTTAAGLRNAGFEGRFLYWRWHASWRGWLVLPAIGDRRFLETQAARLARFVASERERHPDRPIHLVGYSCGGFIAARALELLPDHVTVDSVALLAPAIGPQFDLSAAAGRVSGNLVVCSSVADWLIVGLGTLLAGTADRKNALSMGMVGCRNAQAAAKNVVELKWSVGMLRIGYLGGHFSAAAKSFISRHVASAMGIAQA